MTDWIFQNNRPFRDFQGSIVAILPEIAMALSERAAPRLEPVGQGDRPTTGLALRTGRPASRWAATVFPEHAGR
jgi:hypothetical protein